MSSAVAEAEKLKAAGDAHKRDLVQAKLVEREAELASMRDKLRAATREGSSASLHKHASLQRNGYADAIVRVLTQAGLRTAGR